jgi:enamine deaminase RidA (YjgF/YER057c/UK114 family)
MTNPFGSYTHVVEVNGPGRTIYIAGQLGINGAGRQGADFREQTTLAYENLKAAIESVGGKVENIVKLNAYVTDMRAQAEDDGWRFARHHQEAARPFNRPSKLITSLMNCQREVPQSRNFKGSVCAVGRRAFQNQKGRRTRWIAWRSLRVARGNHAI